MAEAKIAQVVPINNARACAAESFSAGIAFAEVLKTKNEIPRKTGMASKAKKAKKPKTPMVARLLNALDDPVLKVMFHKELLLKSGFLNFEKSYPKVPGPDPKIG